MAAAQERSPDAEKPQWLEGKVNYFSEVKESDKGNKYQRANIILSSGHQIMLNIGEKLFEKNSKVQKGDYVKFPAYVEADANKQIIVKSEKEENIYGFNQAAGMEKTHPRTTSISTDQDGKPVRIMVTAGSDAVITEHEGINRTTLSAYVKGEDLADRSSKDQLVTIKSGPKFHDSLKEVKKGNLIEVEGFVKINQRDTKTFTDIQASKSAVILYSKDQSKDKDQSKQEAKTKTAKPKKTRKKKNEMSR